MQLGAVPECLVWCILKNLTFFTSILLAVADWPPPHIAEPECYLFYNYPFSFTLICIVWIIRTYWDDFKSIILSPSLWTTQAPSCWESFRILPDPPPLWLYTTGSSWHKCNEDNRKGPKGPIKSNWVLMSFDAEWTKIEWQWTWKEAKELKVEMHSRDRKGFHLFKNILPHSASMEVSRVPVGFNKRKLWYLGGEIWKC